MNPYLISILIAIPTLLISRSWRRMRFNAKNGRLDGRTFEPRDENSSADALQTLQQFEHPVSPKPRSSFPWSDVKQCFGHVLPRSTFKLHESCPECGLTSDQLVWIKFTSPKETWKHLCGRSGPLSICPNCKIQVQFILECMN